MLFYFMISLSTYIISIIDLWEIHGEFFNLGVVELSQVGQKLSISGCHEVNSDSFSSESAGTSNSMDVFGCFSGEIIVDDQVHLLDVNTSSQKIGWNQDSWRSRSELSHDVDSFGHLHISWNARDHKLVFSQSVSKFFDSLFSVSEDDALRNDHTLVELEKSSEFLTVFLKRDVKLLDTFKSELLIFDQDLDWLLHKLFSHVNDFRGHGGWEKADLDVSRQILENLSDFINKASAQHFVGFVQDNDLQKVSPQGFLFNEIFYPAGGSDNNMDATILESLSILSGISASDTASGIDFDELAETKDDLVDLLSQFSGGGQDDSLALWRLGVN